MNSLKKINHFTKLYIFQKSIVVISKFKFKFYVFFYEWERVERMIHRSFIIVDDDVDDVQKKSVFSD